MKNRAIVVVLLAVAAVSVLRLASIAEDSKHMAQSDDARKIAEGPSDIFPGKLVDDPNEDGALRKQLQEFLSEEPADKPEMDEIQSLRQQVFVCEQRYRTISVLALLGAGGGENDRRSVLEVRYRYLLAKARLSCAESKWADCRKDAAAAVRTAKTIVLVASARQGEPGRDPNQYIETIDAYSKVTDARLLLAKAIAKCSSSAIQGHK